MDLGPAVKAVGLELIETESREPLRGPEAARHLGRGIDRSRRHRSLRLSISSVTSIAFANSAPPTPSPIREAASRCLVIPQPSLELLRLIFARFEVGNVRHARWSRCAKRRCALESELSHRGLDAYQPAYPGTRVAQSANPATAGSLSSAIHSGPVRSFAAYAPPCNHSTFTSPARNNSRNTLK